MPGLWGRKLPAASMVSTPCVVGLQPWVSGGRRNGGNWGHGVSFDTDGPTGGAGSASKEQVALVYGSGPFDVAELILT